MHTAHTLDLNLLPVLHALLREGSVTSAGRKLGLSQSALSHSLAKLRLHFRDELLVRSGRGMTRTAYAEELHAEVAKLMMAVEGLLQHEVTFEPEAMQRTFALGMSDYFEMDLTEKFLPRFRRLAPSASLFVRTASDFSGLETGDLDLAIGVERAPRAGIFQRLLFEDDLVLLMQKNHPLAKQRSVNLRAFCNAHHLLVAPGETRGGPVDSALAKQNLTRHIALIVPRFANVGHALSSSDLICAYPRKLAGRLSATKHFVTREIPLELPTFRFFLFWHARRQGDRALAWLREQLAVALKDE
jgi:DNA-binding transcriptional LysR family regulator